MSVYDLEVEACRHLARSLRLPFVDLRRYRISPGVLRKIPGEKALRYRCVPMIYNSRRIVLIHDSPADMFFLASEPGALGISGITGAGRSRALEFGLTTRSAFEETLKRRLALPDS